MSDWAERARRRPARAVTVRAPGKINLYVGREPVKFNIPEDEAVERLVDLIKEHDRWIDAPAAVAEV